MTRLACIGIGGLIDRRASGLSDAERLRLEEHLGGCERCRSDAHLLDAVGGTLGLVPPLAPSARERAISRAIERAGQPHTALPARRLRWLPLTAAGLAAVAAAILIVGRVRHSEPARDRVLAGNISVAGRVLPSDAAIPAGTELSARSGTTLALAHARVTVAGEGKLIWDSRASAVVLRAGAVDVDVDPAPHLPFAIQTKRFSVEVLGTQFHVDADGVRVTRGAVRVVGKDGAVLVASLTAGSSWTLEETAQAEPAPAPTPPEEPPPPLVRRRSPHQWLAQARRQLAKNDVDATQRSIASALAAHPGRSDAAEAETLRAECALVSGDRARAAKVYGDVAERYRDLPAGEIALFAAARLEASLDHAHSLALLRTYLDRYPNGRFRREATSRLSDPKR